MKIDFEKLTPLELFSVIESATAELRRRMPQEQAVIVERIPAPAARIIRVNEPKNEDKEFALYVKTRMLSGMFILASDRHRYKEIVASHPEWIATQRMPQDTSGSAARKWTNRHVTYKAAKEL